MDRWTDGQSDRWIDNRWTDNRWIDNRWIDNRWIDNRWIDNRWIDNRWIDNRWIDNRWIDNRWIDNRWIDNRWIDRQMNGWLDEIDLQTNSKIFICPEFLLKKWWVPWLSTHIIKAWKSGRQFNQVFVALVCF